MSTYDEALAAHDQLMANFPDSYFDIWAMGKDKAQEYLDRSEQVRLMFAQARLSGGSISNYSKRHEKDLIDLDAMKTAVDEALGAGTYRKLIRIYDQVCRDSKVIREEMQKWVEENFKA